MKQIILKAAELKQILDMRPGDTITIRREMRPANRWRAGSNGYRLGFGFWVDPDANNADHCGHVKDYSLGPCWETESYYRERYAPFKPGEFLYVREVWGLTTDGFAYKADGMHENVKWHSAPSMPKEASRIFLTVTGNSIVRTDKAEWEFVLKITEKHESGKTCKRRRKE